MKVRMGLRRSGTTVGQWWGTPGGRGEKVRRAWGDLRYRGPSTSRLCRFAQYDGVLETEIGAKRSGPVGKREFVLARLNARYPTLSRAKGWATRIRGGPSCFVGRHHGVGALLFGGEFVVFGMWEIACLICGSHSARTLRPSAWPNCEVKSSALMTYSRIPESIPLGHV